jgi:SAM-dependent methyltransferase
MSNRQRLMVALVMQHLLGTTGQKVYLMEQTTPLYQWIVGHLSMHAITGSEYLGDGYRAGEIVKAWRYHAPLRACALPRTALHKARLFYSMLRMGGVRHEDVTGLSFEAGSLDFIVSNDIFEHVADPWKAFAECARVLRPGGVLLATLPFYRESDTSVVRAKLAAGGINYLLPPIFHGNPVSVDGSLVFTDFGWDVFVDMKEAGFAEVGVEVYASAEYGHFGDGQLVFRARR